jgi:hypothetical protein
MPKIPESYGKVANPSFKTTMAMPDSESTQMTAKLGEQLSGNLMNIATQMQYQSIKEQEAFDAAQIIDFKTKLATFENEKRIALAELPATDPTLFDKTKKTFENERASFINNYTNQYKDNARLSSLIKRQADVEAVDFNFDVDKTLLSKKREYGTNKIYEGIYSINQRLEKGGNPAKLSGELNTILQTGLKAGLIDQNDINREREKQKNIVKDLQVQYEKTRQANLVASGQLHLDPNSGDDRKLGELAYQTQLQNTLKKGGDAESATLNFINKTGFLPQQVKSIWSSQLNMGNPQQKIEAAEQIAQIIESNPRLQNQFNSDDINFVNSIKTRVGLGLPPEQILTYAEKEISKFQSMDRIAKGQIINNKDTKKIIDNSFEGLKDKLTDTGFFSFLKPTPEIEDGIRVKYETLVKDAFLNGNTTPEGAVEYAKTKLQSEYKITNIGKPRVMQYAPEVFYDKYNGGDSSWIKGQLKVEIAKHILVPSLKDLDNQFVLQPTEQTIKGGKPAYNIVKVNDNSVLLDSQNRPVLFAPDIEKADFYKEAQKQYNKNKQYTKEELLSLIEDKKIEGSDKKFRDFRTAGGSKEEIDFLFKKQPEKMQENIVSNSFSLETKLKKIASFISPIAEPILTEAKRDFDIISTKVKKDFMNNERVQYGLANYENLKKESAKTLDGYKDEAMVFFSKMQVFGKYLGIATKRGVDKAISNIDTRLIQFKNSQEIQGDIKNYEATKQNVSNFVDEIKTNYVKFFELVDSKKESIKKDIELVNNFLDIGAQDEKEVESGIDAQKRLEEYYTTIKSITDSITLKTENLSKTINESTQQFVNMSRDYFIKGRQEQEQEEAMESLKFLKENPQVEKLGIKALNDLYEYGREESLTVKAYKKELERIKETNPKAYKPLVKAFYEHFDMATYQKKRVASDEAMSNLKLSDDYFARGLEKEYAIDRKIKELKKQNKK